MVCGAVRNKVFKPLKSLAEQLRSNAELIKQRPQHIAIAEKTCGARNRLRGVQPKVCGARKTAKTQLLEIIDESRGARLRSKKIGFLRVAPQNRRNPLHNLEKDDAEQARSKRSNCGGENPPYPPPVFLRNTGGRPCCGEHQSRKLEMSADRYGRSYWCVKTPLSPSGEIYLHANALSIRDGCLIFTGGDSAVNMTFGAGQWQAAFAASCIDGHAVAVEHWPGEVA